MTVNQCQSFPAISPRPLPGTDGVARGSGQAAAELEPPPPLAPDLRAGGGPWPPAGDASKPETETTVSTKKVQVTRGGLSTKPSPVGKRRSCTRPFPTLLVSISHTIATTTMGNAQVGDLDGIPSPHGHRQNPDDLTEVKGTKTTVVALSWHFSSPVMHHPSWYLPPLPRDMPASRPRCLVSPVRLGQGHRDHGAAAPLASPRTEGVWTCPVLTRRSGRPRCPQPVSPSRCRPNRRPKPSPRRCRRLRRHRVWPWRTHRGSDRREDVPTGVDFE